MNENNEQNGLFSEDYEAPKRENPYLKKNRNRIQLDSLSTEDEPRKKDKPVRENKPVREDKPSEIERETPADEGYTHKRTFSDWMFEHVKVIAALATVLVILSLVLITDVVGMVENLITQSQQADKEEISLTYVKGLSEKSSPVTWEDLERFRFDQTKAKDSVTWMLPVKGTNYELWVSGISTQKPPVYVYLYDMRTGDRLVIGEEDFDTFIEEHSK